MMIEHNFSMPLCHYETQSVSPNEHKVPLYQTWKEELNQRKIYHERKAFETSYGKIYEKIVSVRLSIRQHIVIRLCVKVYD